MEEQDQEETQLIVYSCLSADNIEEAFTSSPLDQTLDMFDWFMTAGRVPHASLPP
jgi:hypothetical protein